MSTEPAALFDLVLSSTDPQRFRDLHWSGTFQDYLELLHREPAIGRSAFQRVYDMIVSFGETRYVENKLPHVHYHFFDDPIEDGRDAVFGLDASLMHLVDIFKAAARGYGTEHRVLLLHGPVGSAKSTLVRMLKKGLEHYSATPEGALYTYTWHLPEELVHEDGAAEMACPMHEDPLHLVPERARAALVAEINRDLPETARIHPEGDLCPACRFVFRELMQRYDGDLAKTLSHVEVRRLVLSEQDRIGIGTFQPKDEKNQDSTELTGDINFRKIAEYGSDSDPRAFNFDGEFNIANRGVIEFVEVLKLDVAFLYDLLGASQEHRIKPKKFPQTHIDEVIIGHTNEPEYRRLQSNEFMEALRDRTVKIDVPYITRLSDEIRIYEKDYGAGQVHGKHIAPHTLEVGAMWAILTRLSEPKKAKLSLLQKLKLYDGKSLPGYTEENVRELRREAPREGMEGISPRYIQDKISNALVKEDHQGCVNPFMVLNELESGLSHHSLITSDEQRKRYIDLMAVVKEEYENLVKSDVQRAISADTELIAQLCANYIDNVKAYTQKEKVKNPYTGDDEEPDERLMRSIEEKIDIPESRKDDFRTEIMNYIGALAIEGKQFDYTTNARLQKALELKLFEDQKDTIKLSSLVSGTVDEKTQEKIDVVKGRLKKSYGYCDVCATDVLNYVSSIFARGDVKREE